MSILTTKKRNSLKKSQFALPATEKYPVYDRTHAGNAKARAKQQLNRGNISKSTYDKIIAAANHVLKKKD